MFCFGVVVFFIFCHLYFKCIILDFCGTCFFFSYYVYGYEPKNHGELLVRENLILKMHEKATN